MKNHRPVRVGTRKSKLARRQAEQVVDLLRQVHPDLTWKVRTLLTEGDRRPRVPLREMAGRGVFTTQLEEALKAGEIDIAVHSLKDLPTEQDPALCLAAVPARGDPRECLVSRSGAGLASLPPGAVIGTSSTRREAQLRALRPDLRFRPIRGNVDTRIHKVVEAALYDATLLAAAGIRRLGLEEHVSEWFSLRKLLPAPGQAALAVQCREEDPRTRAMLSAIDDHRARASITAERTFLEELGGGCVLPVAAFAKCVGSSAGGELRLSGTIFSVDGSQRIDVNGSGDSPRELGLSVAHRALKRGALGLIRGRSQPARPLEGKRIVVTRAAAQSKYLTDRLRTLGARPLNLPVIRIAPLSKPDGLEEALGRRHEYDWIVFTSANGVNAWFQLVPGPDWHPAALRVAAIGPRTAAELEARGLKPSRMPSEYGKHQLVESLGDVGGLRILLPRGELAGPGLANLLTARGARVDDIVVYRTLPVVPDQAGVRRLGAGIDAMLFTSSSTVRHFVAALDGLSLGPAQLQRAIVACIGPATARTAEELGLVGGALFAELIVARHYTTEGLVEALVDYYREEHGD